MTKTNFSLLTLALLTSTSVMARVVEPSFTVESAIHTYKINADATYELIEEVITRINTQQTANDSPDDQLPFKAGKESIKVVAKKNPVKKFMLTPNLNNTCDILRLPEQYMGDTKVCNLNQIFLYISRIQ